MSMPTRFVCWAERKQPLTARDFLRCRVVDAATSRMRPKGKRTKVTGHCLGRVSCAADPGDKLAGRPLNRLLRYIGKDMCVE